LKINKMNHQISAVEWRTTDNTLRIKMQDGREATADAYGFMKWIAYKYEGWLFEPRIGTVVIAYGKTCRVYTPNTVRMHLGDESFFAHLAEWLNQCEAEEVEEAADDSEETMQDAADDAWREMRRQQGIL
jgi:hypothetical protein